ncbi:Lpg2936 family Dot/Icm T4SS effector methyltransferase [Arcobacter sp. 15-2]|uniref:16S rRNA (uracil(1498)-N(3))-methyltransferase n=1 Tax=Arcobacter sp. 15-2 TaxID=3374109 RepID=UPI00399D366A
MQYTYHKDSSTETIEIEAELHKYLFKVRRHNIDEDLYFRNLKDKNIYRYRVQSINRRKTILSLQGSEEKIVEPQKELHIGWCKIEPKSIEKVIASLNELGVTKITFINCEFSQKKYTINYEKLEKLLINSSQQSGRSSIIALEESDSLKTFLSENKESYMFNFSKNLVDDVKSDIRTIVIGCEGGFSDEEITLVEKQKIVGIDSSLILRSETGVITLASKISV